MSGLVRGAHQSINDKQHTEDIVAQPGQTATRLAALSANICAYRVANRAHQPDAKHAYGDDHVASNQGSMERLGYQ